VSLADEFREDLGAKLLTRPDDALVMVRVRNLPRIVAVLEAAERLRACDDTPKAGLTAWHDAVRDVVDAMRGGENAP
jgi:D-mannonate dehydratase